MAETKKAKIKSTGVVIEVYKLVNGNWCNYSDCKTQYSESELQFI